MQILGFDDPALDAVVKLRLFVNEDLRLIADDDEARSLHGLVIELLPRQKTIAPDEASDMHAVFEPFTLHDGIDGIRRGAHDIAALHCLFGGFHGHHFDAGFGAHLFGEPLAILRGRTVDLDFCKRPDSQVRRHLSFCLFSGTEQPHDFGVFTRKIFAGNGACGADPHCRNVVVIHDRQQFAGIHVEEHDETNEITGVNATFAAGDLDFLGKARVDAQRHGFNARHQSHDVIEIVLSAFLFPRSPEPSTRGVHGFAFAQFPKRLLDGFDFLRHWKQIFHLLVLENQDH